MSALIALAIAVLFSGSTTSRVSYPDCTATELDWTYNSISQNPCEVAAYMESTCSDDGFTIGPLPTGAVYMGPNGSEDSDLCKCNTITYSLLSACAACQGESWVRWAKWATHCTAILPPSAFPYPVPLEIRVPQWALLDVTLENNWNLKNAKSLGDSPEIGPGVLIGASNSFITSSTGSPTVLATTTNLSSITSSIATLNAQSPLSASLAGPSIKVSVVGGVVGGIALVVIVIAVLGVCYTRRQRLKAISDAREEAFKSLTDGALASSASLMPTLSVVNPTRVYPEDTSDREIAFRQHREAIYVQNVPPQAIFGSHKRRRKTLRSQIPQNAPRADSGSSFGTFANLV